jgi:hypothetical protein
MARVAIKGTAPAVGARNPGKSRNPVAREFHGLSEYDGLDRRDPLPSSSASFAYGWQH